MMKRLFLIASVSMLAFWQCTQPKGNVSEFAGVSHVEQGNPISVMLTSYSTTLIANGSDYTNLRIALTDSIERQLVNATDTILIFVTGDGTITAADGSALIFFNDTAGLKYTICQLENGVCNLTFVAGKNPDKVKVEARCGNLWPGSHEIHTIPASTILQKPLPEQLPATIKPIDKMIGSDISFLPQLEDKGLKFYENNKPVDAIQLLKSHGFNYVRLRIFVNPENENGYAPGKGYCNLEYTLGMAQRVKDAGMKLLLDFHYSDYWADPQQQNKPKAWQNLDFETLKDSVETYTARVLLAFKQKNLMPNMVQIGNEINHGIIWPDGHISNLDQLAELLKAGVSGAKQVAPEAPLMMHVALGGQNKESVFWFDNMIARGVQFDVIGLSYYPRWHGTLDDLKFNMNDLIKRYNKPINVVEYSDYKKEVHDISFGLPNNMGKGACIWEPLSWRTNMVKKDGTITDIVLIYDELCKKYLN